MKSDIIEIVGVPVFSNLNERNSFLLTSRSAFSDYKFHDDIEKVKQEFQDKEVIDFIIKNKDLTLDEFTIELQKIIG